jgi:hypothetical protein
MSCWVVPAVAAELWQMPVGQIIERARKGQIPTKTELGFMLVDVAPDSPRIEYPIREPASRARTYTPAQACADEAGQDEQLDWRPTRARMARLRRPPAPPHQALAQAA